MKCRLCGKTLFEIKGYLKRVNPTGMEGIWECRPTCGAVRSNEQNILDALDNKP